MQVDGRNSIFAEWRRAEVPSGQWCLPRAPKKSPCGLSRQQLGSPPSVPARALPAVVRGNKYLDGEFRLVALLQDGAIVQIRSRNLHEMERFAPGSTVELSWNPEDALVLRAKRHDTPLNDPETSKAVPKGHLPH
jgi:hypothetical protein